MSEPLWRPPEQRVAASNLARFAAEAEASSGAPAGGYDALHAWSVDRPQAFWRAVWDFAEIVGDPGSVVVRGFERMPGAVWFPEAKLNYAENLLRRRGTDPAIVFCSEGRAPRTLSHHELCAAVAGLQQTLLRLGVAPGDRVAGFVPNLPETVVAMLAAASIGAVWSSCSPDFGVAGAVDRFGQIEPKLLFAADGYGYNGAKHDSLERVAAMQVEIPSIQHTIVIGHANEEPDLSGLRNAVHFAEAVGNAAPESIRFERVAFDHPLFILYSSGTTGPPKCIVHGTGGTLLQHVKEHRLQVDLKSGDRFFYFTTCGWMMWNWLVSGLASEATLVLYDGSPFHPDGNVLFDLADAVGIDVFGTSAKFLDAVAKAGLEPARSHDLASVKTILSTGSPLAEEGFDFVYQHVKGDVALASISGGTDIISCFVGGNPLGPVWRGEIQAPGLGMAVDVFDDAGRPLPRGKGELVCTRPFPSMPLGFFDDPTGERYRKAYFERFPGAWCQGDFAERTDHGGFRIHGRSDAVLNPGGVRIGTAEIYRQVEKIDEVVEGLVIGQQWEGDVRVVLFVKLRPGLRLDDALAQRIRDEVRRHATPRHVPARIVQVDDIPRTKSGKIVELAVRRIVHGEPVPNREALANPEALDLFADRPELRD